MKKTITVLNLCAMLLGLSFSVHAQDNFFQGKSVRIIRGGQAGDLYDLWTRHIATYLGNIFRAIQASQCKTCRARVR